MKNILFLETGTPTVDNGAGGSVYSLLEIVKGIHKENYNITILFYNYFNISERFNEYNCNVITKNSLSNSVANNSNAKSMKSKSNYNIIKYAKFNLRWIKLIPEIRYLIKILKKNNVEIIHCNDRLSTNISGVVAAKFIGIKVIVHQRQFEQKLPHIVKYFGKKVDKYFAISTSIAENLIEESFIPSTKIDVLNNWISTINNQGTMVKSNANNILWLGRIVPWKGTHLLIEIVELFLALDINFNKVIIFGAPDSSSTDYFNSIKEEISKKNLTSYFEFKGYIEFDDIDLTKYKVYIHTSIEPEPFGRTIIEAMNNCLPVFATNLGGVKDIIVDGNNGFLYDPQNIPQFKEKFLMIENEKKISSIINNAKASIETQFSGRTQIETLLKYYKSLN